MFRKGLIICALVLAGMPIDAAPRSITEITVTDDLGYACIDPSYLEEDADGPAAVAFTLSGKIRMPRTCLPEPCARALTRTELSGLTGTETILPRFEDEWDDYISRYADHCRKEVVPFGRYKLKRLITPKTFWTPLIQPPGLISDVYPPLLTRRIVPPPILRPLAPMVPGISAKICNEPARTHAMWVMEDDGQGNICRAGGGTAAGSTGSGVAPVPLPAGLWFLLTGFASMVILRKR